MGQQPHEVLLMNDEISLNVYGEPHFYEWHLDTGAWNALPDDAWAWTVYVPLDRAQPSDGGGWLRFREGGPPWTKPHATERDAHFDPGDVLVFDRWAWHRLEPFSHFRPTRLAYILRVTNDSRSVHLPLSPRTQPPLARTTPYDIGWQINYYCDEEKQRAGCRLPLSVGGRRQSAAMRSGPAGTRPPSIVAAICSKATPGAPWVTPFVRKK